ncbi:MAG: type II toxin-antitoxin system RelE/ParE family toxin [Acidobacteriaceae bacterium]
MKQIRWTTQATKQLVAAYDFVFEENATAAANLSVKILRAVEQLVNFPEMGRPGRISGTRELVIPGTPYIVAYRLKGATVRILSLLHAARRWHTQL